MAKEVTVNLGFTRNMGDFESLRIDLGMTDEPRPGETMQSALNRVKDYISSRLLDDLAEVEADIVATRQTIRSGQPYKKKVASAAEREEKENK